MGSRLRDDQLSLMPVRKGYMNRFVAARAFSSDRQSSIYHVALTK